jgi:hypothetical protein
MRRNQLLEDIHEFRARAIELRECRTLAEDALKQSYELLELEVPDRFLGRSSWSSNKSAFVGRDSDG